MTKPNTEETIWDAVFDAEGDVNRALCLALLLKNRLEDADPIHAEEHNAWCLVASELFGACRRIVKQHEKQFDLAKTTIKPRLVA